MMGYSAITLWISLLVAAALAQAQTAAPVKCPPVALTEIQVLDLVKGGLPDNRIAQIVETCHIGFLPSAYVVQRMSQAGTTDLVLQSLIKDGYSHLTLTQARGEVAMLERKIAELTASSNAARDSGLSRLDAESSPKLADARQVSPQDQFESDAAFAARKKRSESAVADIARALATDKQQVSQRYKDDLASKTKPFSQQLSILKERTYEDGGTKPEFIRYDANRNLLLAKVGETEYWFTIPNDKAREFYAQWTNIRVERAVEEDPNRTRTLVDPASSERYAGIPGEVAEAAEREQQRLAALARVTGVAWLDDNTRLMWTRQDNGSDLSSNQAVSYCRNVRTGGYRDWRLPEIAELQGIYDPSTLSHIKGGIRHSGYWEWSATKSGSGKAWVFLFSAGTQYSGELSSSISSRALCVRGADPSNLSNGTAFSGAAGSSVGIGDVFRVGGGVSQPAVIYKVDPEYSEQARQAKQSGTVMLSVIVDVEGYARDIHVVNGLGMDLDEKAIEAVEKWKFRPGMKDGQPVNVRATIEINFRLF